MSFNLLSLASRFGLAGLVNTAIGLSVIAALDLGLKVDPHIANAVGYAGGLTSGYLLNRMFVFRCREDISLTGTKYLAAVGVAFVANQAVLAATRPLYGDGTLGHLAAQLTGMATYTLLTFALCRLWVFKPQPKAATASAET